MNELPYRNVYVTIGNSDNKLDQHDWSSFCREVDNLVRAFATDMYGEFYALSNAPWQNACWSFTIHGSAIEPAKINLRQLAADFEQDSIVWAEANVEFLDSSR